MDCWVGGALVSLVFLGVGGVLDWVFREVDPEVWAPGLVLAVPFGVCEVVGVVGGPVFLVAGLVMWAAMLVLYLLGFMGGADVAAALLVALALPVPRCAGCGLLGFLPPVLVVVLVGTLVGLAYKVLEIRRAVRLGGRVRGLGVEVRREDLVEGALRWWVPEGVGVEEEWSWGLAGLGGRVRASPGSPMVSFMLVGLIVYLAAALALHY